MSERVDLVDANGVVQAWRVLRSQYEKHRYTRYFDLHMQNVIVTVVAPNGDILVHERAEGKSEEGKIDLVCETIQASEEPKDAAIRGVREESGVRLDEDDTIMLVAAGMNEYGRYCRRFAVRLDSEKPASVQDPREAVWVDFKPRAELEAMPEDTFVDGFWTDANQAAVKLDGMQHGAGVI